MKLIQPKARLIIQHPGIDGIYKQVELAGRICYRSEDKITEDSAEDFVWRMINSNHTAMLEHGTIYLSIPRSVKCKQAIRAPYSRLNIANRFYHLTTNLRVVREYNLNKWLQYICDPSKFHEKRYTFWLTTDRGVSHELVRHRAMSFAQESQRYCAYDKDKFHSSCTYIKPHWFTAPIEEFKPSREMSKILEIEESTFCSSLYEAETVYEFLRSRGLAAQEARGVLSNATKTEVVMTGFSNDWRHFFDLRFFGKTGKPHPDMLHLAKLMKEEAERHGIWNEIMNQPSKFK